MLHYLQRLQEEDREDKEGKRETQRRLMEEVARCNEVRGREGGRERGGKEGGRE